MVVLNVKVKGETRFLFETKLTDNVDKTLERLLNIYNGQLKVLRVVSHMEDLVRYGVSVPPEMRGLLEDQIKELDLRDDHQGPSGGHEENKDPCQKRNGRRPKEDMRQVLERTMAEARAKISKENAKANNCLTYSHVIEALDMLKGAISIVYPMGLPEYDPIRMELENCEDLIQGDKADVLDPAQAVMWFSSKDMMRDKKLQDYLGKNEKTKVIVKLVAKAAGQPPREPVFSEEDQAKLMIANHKRKEELAELDRAAQNDDSYLNSRWADPNSLKRRMHGVDNVHWK